MLIKNMYSLFLILGVCMYICMSACMHVRMPVYGILDEFAPPPLSQECLGVGVGNAPALIREQQSPESGTAVRSRLKHNSEQALWQCSESYPNQQEHA